MSRTVRSQPHRLDELQRQASVDLNSTLGVGGSLVRLARLVGPQESVHRLGVGTYGRRGALVGVLGTRVVIIATHPFGHRVQSIPIRTVESAELSHRLGADVLILRTGRAIHRVAGMSPSEARGVAESVASVQRSLAEIARSA